MRLKLVAWISVHDFLFGFDLCRQTYGHHYLEGLYDILGQHNLHSFQGFKCELQHLLDRYGFDGVSHAIVDRTDPTCSQTFELPGDEVLGLWFEREREIAREQEIDRTMQKRVPDNH